VVASTSIILLRMRSDAQTKILAVDAMVLRAKFFSEIFLSDSIMGKQQITATAIRKMLFTNEILSVIAINPFPPKPKIALKKLPSFPRFSK